MKFQSIVAGVLAAVLVAGVVAGLHGVSERKLERHFDQLALANAKDCRMGLVADELVLQHGDYLPVYGSCELVYPQRERIDHFFASRPTGFRVAPSGDRGVTSLLMAERFAALGEQLRGKRVMVILTPEWFFRPQANDPTYEGNFSVEHALAALASSSLPASIKSRLAARMADYPRTLEKNVFLSQLVSIWRDATPARRALLPMVDGFSRAFLGVQRELDPAFTYMALRRRLRDSHINVPAEKPESIDWARYFNHSEKEFVKLSGSNPYGFRDTLWEKVERKPRTYFYKSGDQQFAQRLYGSKEWEDYDLMLAVLAHYGAEPLIVSVPINAHYLEALGISSAAWEGYYSRVCRLAHQYRFKVADFRAHENETDFFGFADPNPKGWIYINRVADAFYHGRFAALRSLL